VGGVAVALKVGELYSTLELDARKFNQGITAAQTQVKGMSTMLKVGLAGAAVAAGAALYKMAKTGLQNVRELDDAVKQFQVATGASAAEAEKAQRVIQKLYRQNTDSYAELGAAITRMQQRYGDLGDDLEKHTQSFLDFAKVTGQDTTQAIDDVTNVLLAFNRSLNDAVPLMDSLLAVSQKTGASLPSLQRALAESAPAMAALNIPLEEGIALLGHLEARGVGADAAVQGLRYAMQALENPTKEQADALRVLGIGFQELRDGSIRVAEDAFPMLIKRLSEGSLSAKETDAALRILGMRAGQDMVRGLQNGEEGIKSLINTIEESEGVVNKASQTYDKQLGERWELIRRKYLVPFMETLGHGLLTVLEDVAGFIEEWGPQVEAVFASLKSAIGDFYEFCKWAFSGLSKLLLNFYDTVRQSANEVDKMMDYIEKKYSPERARRTAREFVREFMFPEHLLPKPELKVVEEAGEKVQRAIKPIPEIAQSAALAVEGMTEAGEHATSAYEDLSHQIEALAAMSQYEQRYEGAPLPMPEFKKMEWDFGALEEARRAGQQVAEEMEKAAIAEQGVLNTINAIVDQVQYMNMPLEEAVMKLEAIKGSTEPLSDEWKRATDMIKQYKSELDETAKKSSELEIQSKLWANNLIEGLADAVVYGRNLSEVLSNILKQLASSLLQRFIWGILPIPGLKMHSGGVVGLAGTPMMVPAGTFIGAPRLHNGLAPDEFPAILQRGETVLPRGADTTSSTSVKIVNVLDPSIVGNYLGTAEGERVIVNIMQKNIRRLT
jgi:TP901 family phage tail tape measure protein